MRAARFWSWPIAVIGGGCIIAAAALGIGTISEAAKLSAYHDARPCPAGAPGGSSCLQTIPGTVTAVTEFPGGYRVSPDYALDVRTRSGTLDLGFSSDNPMLAYATDGSPATVTMWRDIAVLVSTDGRSAPTVGVPETALARDLGNTEKSLAVGIFLIFAFMGARMQQRRAGPGPVRPLRHLAMIGLLLSAFVLVGAAIGLGGQPSRLAPDLIGTGIGLAVVTGLTVWAGVRLRRNAASSEAGHGGQPAHARYTTSSPGYDAPHPPGHVQAAWRAGGAAGLAGPARPRLSPGQRTVVWRRAVGTFAFPFLMPGLIVGVLFGIGLTAHDGPQARAYQDAPACTGQANVASCAGYFTAYVNGVRTSATGAGGAEVSFATPPRGVINAWGDFWGNVAPTAESYEQGHTLTTIRAWRGTIVGAQFGNTWQWVNGAPPGDTAPVILLATCFALLLLAVRLRVHSLARHAAVSGADRRRLILEDAGQTVTAAAGVVLLAAGFWPGALLALGALAWLGLSVRAVTRRGRTRLGLQHAA